MKSLLLAVAILVLPLSTPGAAATGPACTLAPGLPAVPNGGTACSLALGFGMLTVQDRLSAGAAFCSTVPLAPFNCDPTSLVPAYGAAVFSTAGLPAPAAGSGRALDVWVNNPAGVGTCGVQGILCGFDILLCADVDDDHLCSSATGDSLFYAMAHDGFNLHPAGVPGACPKDTKAACSGTSAEIKTACIAPDTALAGGGWDNVVVFIGVWVGAQDQRLGDPKDFLGTGAAFTIHSVDVTDRGNCVVGPTPTHPVAVGYTTVP